MIPLTVKLSQKTTIADYIIYFRKSKDTHPDENVLYTKPQIKISIVAK